MKKLLFITLLSTVVLFVSSCEKDKVNARQIEGNWALVEMTHLREDGIKETISSAILDKTGANNLISFIKGDASTYVPKFASQTVNNSTIEFTYQIGGNNAINIQMPEPTREALPLTAMGRVQPYSYEFVNKNTLRFVAEKEFLSDRKEVIEQVTYVFKRQ